MVPYRELPITSTLDHLVAQPSPEVVNDLVERVPRPPIVGFRPERPEEGVATDHATRRGERHVGQHGETLGGQSDGLAVQPNHRRTEGEQPHRALSAHGALPPRAAQGLPPPQRGG